MDYFILIILGIFLFCAYLSVLIIIDIHENPLLYIDYYRNKKIETWKRNNPSIYRDIYGMPLWVGQKVIFTKTFINGDIEEWIGTIDGFEDNHCIITADFDDCNYIDYYYCKNNRFEKIRYFDEELDKEFLVKTIKKIGENEQLKKQFKNMKFKKVILIE